MGTKESLLELERELWNADEEFYRDTLSEDALMVFPEPTGILERSAVLEALGGADRWQRIKFDNERSRRRYRPTGLPSGCRTQ
jgi:hypothetical protein